MAHLAKLGAAVAVIAILATPAAAARISLTRQARPVTDLEIAGGAPLGALVHEFFVTADSDLLSISNVAIDVPAYRNPFASESAAPAADLAALSSAASASSFITMPGSTVVLGGGFDGAGPDRLWGDLSNDGPQQNFLFARLTAGQTGSFAGTLAVNDRGTPVNLPFRFSLPGTVADLSLLDAEPRHSLDYGFDLPVPPVVPPVTPPPVLPPVNPTLQPPGPSPIDPTLPPSIPGGALGSLSLTRQSRVVTFEEVAGGAPAGGIVHDFFLSSTTDVLSVMNVRVDAPLYQHELGDPNNAGSPPPGLASGFPALGADSFVDTPGDTIRLGADLPGDGITTFGDLDASGAQENFHFARMTVTQSGAFSGDVAVLGYPGSVVSLPFDFFLPGTEAELATWAEPAPLTLEYSLDPPLPVVVEPSPAPIVDVPPILPPVVEDTPPIVETPPTIETPPFDPSQGTEPSIVIVNPVVPIDWLHEEWWNWQGREPFAIGEAVEIFELGEIVEIAPGVVMIKAWPDGGAATIDLGAGIDVVAWDGVSPMLVGVTGLSGDAMLTSIAASDSDAASLALGRATFFAADISQFAATSGDAGALIPEPATAPLMAMISLLPVAGARWSQRRARRGRRWCPELPSSFKSPPRFASYLVLARPKLRARIRPAPAAAAVRHAPRRRGEPQVPSPRGLISGPWRHRSRGATMRLGSQATVRPIGDNRRQHPCGEPQPPRANRRLLTIFGRNPRKTGPHPSHDFRRSLGMSGNPGPSPPRTCIPDLWSRTVPNHVPRPPSPGHRPRARGGVLPSLGPRQRPAAAVRHHRRLRPGGFGSGVVGVDPCRAHRAVSARGRLRRVWRLRVAVPAGILLAVGVAGGARGPAAAGDLQHQRRGAAPRPGRGGPTRRPAGPLGRRQPDAAHRGRGPAHGVVRGDA